MSGAFRAVSHKRVVNVTEAAIKAGIAQNSCHCPITRAINEQYPELKRVIVDWATIRFTDTDNARYIYFTPNPAKDFISAFDQGVPVKPFSFTVRMATQILPPRVGARSAHRPRAIVEVKATRPAGDRVVHLSPTIIGGQALPLAKPREGAPKPGHRIYGLKQFTAQEDFDEQEASDPR